MLIAVITAVGAVVSAVAGVLLAISTKRQLRLKEAEERRQLTSQIWKWADVARSADWRRPVLPREDLERLSRDDFAREVRAAVMRFEKQAKDDSRRLVLDERMRLLEGVLTYLAKPSRTPKTSMPGWALSLLSHEDADRYSREWSAHLFERVESGELREARRDRRRLTYGAILLAVALRVRSVLGRVRT